MTIARTLRRLSAAGLVTVEGKTYGTAPVWVAMLERDDRKTLTARGHTPRAAIRGLAVELDLAQARNR